MYVCKSYFSTVLFSVSELIRQILNIKYIYSTFYGNIYEPFLMVPIHWRPSWIITFWPSVDKPNVYYNKMLLHLKIFYNLEKYIKTYFSKKNNNFYCQTLLFHRHIERPVLRFWFCVCSVRWRSACVSRRSCHPGGFEPKHSPLSLKALLTLSPTVGRHIWGTGGAQVARCSRVYTASPGPDERSSLTYIVSIKSDLRWMLGKKKKKKPEVNVWAWEGWWCHRLEQITP